jgi:hypothetical protein
MRSASASTLRAIGAEVGKSIASVPTAGDGFEAARSGFAERVEAIADRYPLYAQLGAATAAAV